MMKLSLMASHGCPIGLGVVFPTEQGHGKVLKDPNHILPYHGSNQDLIYPPSSALSLQQKDEWKSAGGFLDCNQFVKRDSLSTSRRLIDAPDNHPDLVLLSSGIAERFARQEKITKLLASGSIDEECDLQDLSMLHELMGPQLLLADLPQQSLVYPAREFFINEPTLDKLQYNDTGTEMHEVLSVMSRLYLSKNANKSTKAMVVPYFEWRRRPRTNFNATKVATEKVESLNSQEQSKAKTSHKKKTSTKTTRERDVYGDSYLHACESLLSVMFVRNQQDKNAIQSLKRSGRQLPELLVQVAASIAGTGIALLLSVAYRVTCGRVPLCTSKLMSSGLGLGLVWLSWGVNRLRDTVISISKNPGENEDEMMGNLDKNLKDIYFRAAALMAVVVLKLA